MYASTSSFSHDARPSIPTGDSLPPYQQRGSATTAADWQAHAPGTMSNPFTAGGSSGRTTTTTQPQQYASRAPGLSSSSTAGASHTISYDDYLSRDEQWGAAGSQRGTQGSATAGGYKTPATAASPAGAYEASGAGADYADAGWGGQQGASRDSGSRMSTREHEREQQQQQRRLRYEEEARQAREEWDRTQREAAARRAAAEAAPNRKPRVRYHEVHDDAGWGTGHQAGSREPAYAYAGAGQGSTQQQQERKQQAPDWLEVLGKVFAGGPAYAGHAPDL